MQIKTFSITVDAPEEAEDLMNRFLRGHRILQIDRHFLDIGVASRWVYSVEYMEAQSKPTPEKAVGKTGRIDYKEVLDAAAFSLFSKLRELRKELAVKDAVPAYAVFTNEQLASMVKPVAQSKGDLLKIEGVGEAKFEKYGAAVLKLLSNETSQSPSDTDRANGESAGSIPAGESGQAG